MPTEKKLRVFKIEDSGTVEEYSIRDSHINLAYGVCSTEEATAAKVVTLVNDPGWELKAGSMISVKFLYPVPVASTLNVDNTGAKDIWQHGAAAVNVIRANDTVQLVYDGTRYSILAIDSASQLRPGEAGGLATLDASGKIPGSQLPSYVDDVLEFANRVDFPVTGESGKIYVDTSSNESYRWSGSTYIRIDDVDEFVGATENTSGSAGLVPAPASGDQHKFLGANGQWNDLDASIDIDISLPVDGWSATQPYTYTWLDSNVTDGCTVKVYFLTGSEEDDTLFIEFEKVAGGVQFTAPTLPTDPIPVRIHLIYFETGINVQEPTEADRISTDAIHGAANVEEALTTLDNKFNAKLDKPVNVPADRFLRTDADGQAVWAAAASSSEVADAVSDWLSDNITTGQTIALDESLTVAGAAGDAKATGDRLDAFADAETGIVAVSETQPQSTDNRLWIKDGEVEEYSVPTYAEHEALSEEVTELKDAFDDLENDVSVSVARVDNAVNNFGFSSSMKAALVECLRHVAWVDEDADDYYNDFYDAMYNNTWAITQTLIHCISTNAITEILKGASYYAVIVPMVGYTLTEATVSITMNGVDITNAVYDNGTINIPSVTGSLAITIETDSLDIEYLNAEFDQDEEIIYTSDPLSYLKHFLTVTATYVNGTSRILDSDEYSVNGTLSVGSSTMYVLVEGKTASFSVTVVQGLPTGYTSARWITSNGDNYALTNIANQSGLSAKYKFRKTSVYGRQVDGNIMAGGNWVMPYMRNNSSGNTIIVFNRYGHNNSGTAYSWELDTDYEIEAFIGGNDIRINGQTVVSNWAEGTPSTPVETNLAIAANATSTAKEYRLFGRIYYIELYKDNVLVNKFMPCIETATDVAGFYDTVSQTFISSATSTPFTAGWYDE